MSVEIVGRAKSPSKYPSTKFSLINGPKSQVIVTISKSFVASVGEVGNVIGSKAVVRKE